MIWRLAVGRGREAVVRQLLVVLGTAVASVLLLEAVGVLLLARRGLYQSASFRSFNKATGPAGVGAINVSYLIEPGLRHGVVAGFVLCTVPLLVFVAVASRVAVRQRDERLATLRLAGASDLQVRGLAALDTGFAALVGTVLGAVAFVVARTAVVAAADPDGQVSAVARGTAPGVPLGVLVLVALVVGVVLVAALSLRSVVVTPLGIVRKALRRAPRPWGLLLLVGGLLGLLLGRLAAPDGQSSLLVLALALAATMVGLVTCVPWLTYLTGSALVRWGRGPATLLAGRRLQDDPRSQARAMSALVLVVLAAALAVIVYADTFAYSGRDAADDRFYRQGFQAAAVGMAFSGLVAGAGLLLTTAEGLVERRRTLARLAAAGTDPSTLRRAVLLQVAWPTLPAAVLATVTGVLVLASTVTDASFVVPGLLALPVAAVAVSLLAGAASLPFLRRATDLEQLRVA